MSKNVFLMCSLTLLAAFSAFAHEAAPVAPTTPVAPAVVAPQGSEDAQAPANDQKPNVACGRCGKGKGSLIAAANETVPPVKPEDAEIKDENEPEQKALACGCRKGKKGSVLAQADTKADSTVAPSADEEETEEEAPKEEKKMFACECESAPEVIEEVGAPKETQV